MIRKSNFNKVLILGSGALQIGQAGEFDYSGSQAIKALKEEGIRTVLINPNIATIQTSREMADEVYFLPISAGIVEKVIIKEKPDAVLLGFGGQTALNVGLQLYRKGVFEKYNIEILGTPADAIEKTENREFFAREVEYLGLKLAKSFTAVNVEDALEKAKLLGFPVMVRIAFALGGLGSGIVLTEEELVEKARRAFSFTDQILLEESLYGWKEIEYEIVRDKFNNTIAVCSMENLDPMGIHTGDSLVIAPVQTLSAREHFKLRSIAFKLIERLGIIGECNIQYALSPHSEDYRIIEVNARLSRSSALASKATGYPLAFVATKLSLGYALNEIENSVTGITSAAFEPALDYIALKLPRWDLQKFDQVSSILDSEMKSVGEVMAIGRSFEEALQKGIRMLDIGAEGFEAGIAAGIENIEEELGKPSPNRLFQIAAALIQGFSVERIYELTRIDKWFLHKMYGIVKTANFFEGRSLESFSFEELQYLKRMGFSDRQIANLTGSSEEEVRTRRKSVGLLPVVKQIDTLAAEFPAKTNYLYLTYNGQENDIPLGDGGNQVIVLGSGAYRIGSSVEFDWCCVNAGKTIENVGLKPVMINYNPETVSTDHDSFYKLYFDELSLERVLDICELENPIGVIVSVGGQIPNTLSTKLYQHGIRILGTHPRQIDNAESRNKFSGILDRLKIDQPEWRELEDFNSAKEFCNEVGYPVLIRPSYVLSGASMSIVLNEKELEIYLKRNSVISSEYPVVISKFVTDAREIEVDAVADKGEIILYAISEHVENAGVHSGDATIVFPPQRTYLETMRKVKLTTRQIARALEITGPFNIQFLARENKIKVIECNLRASRSFPFISKALKINFIDVAIRSILGEEIPPINKNSFDLDYVGVKAPQFSFTRLKGSDPVSGVEMVSTGEVACLGDDFNEAFLKSMLSVGYRIPRTGILLSTGNVSEKAQLIDELGSLMEKGIKLFGTRKTAEFYRHNGIKVKILKRPYEEGEPSILNYLRMGKIDLVVNIPKTFEKVELDSDYIIRRKALDFNIPLITNIQVARRFFKSILEYNPDNIDIKSWREYH